MNAGILTPYWLAGYVFLKSLFAIPRTAASSSTAPVAPSRIRDCQQCRRLAKAVHYIFYLDVSDDEVKKRIALRRETEGRADDHVIDKRLEEYYASTEKAIAFYRQQGVLTEVDGERPPEAIAADVRAALSLS